jgi:lysyl-tRNA synthetase class I
VKSFIRENNYTIKFLNSCSAGFSGVRTDKAIIICSPLHMASVGDFLYTIFHEIRHEQQISIFKMGNPTIDSLDDFEELSEKYWEMELDADSFAKRKIAEIVMKSKMPVEIAKILFRLSHYVEDYPSLSKMVKFQITKIANQLKQMRDSGQEIKDISDHPFVKQHLDKLEEFI